MALLINFHWHRKCLNFGAGGLHKKTRLPTNPKVKVVNDLVLGANWFKHCSLLLQGAQGEQSSECDLSMIWNTRCSPLSPDDLWPVPWRSLCLSLERLYYQHCNVKVFQKCKMYFFIKKGPFSAVLYSSKGEEVDSSRWLYVIILTAFTFAGFTKSLWIDWHQVEFPGQRKQITVPWEHEDGFKMYVSIQYAILCFRWCSWLWPWPVLSDSIKVK